jgi:hypothetical protein
VKPYYELRIYECLEGRLPEMNARLRNELPKLFVRHRLPIPVGCWTLSSGGFTGAMVFILPYQDIDHRLLALNRLLQDPDWQEIQKNGNAGRPMVSSALSILLKPLNSANTLVATTAPLSEIHDMIFVSMDYSVSEAAKIRLETQSLPFIGVKGGSLLGAFEVIFGPGSPCAVLFVSWPSWQNRQSWLNETAELGNHAIFGGQSEPSPFKRIDIHPLRPTEYCQARPHFAEFDWLSALVGEST